MTTYLLDVNLLLALSDPMHVHHNIVDQYGFGPSVINRAPRLRVR